MATWYHGVRYALRWDGGELSQRMHVAAKRGLATAAAHLEKYIKELISLPGPMSRSRRMQLVVLRNRKASLITRARAASASIRGSLQSVATSPRKYASQQRKNQRAIARRAQALKQLAKVDEKLNRPEFMEGRASLPGEPPRRRTGILRSSIGWAVKEELTVRVGSGVPYARYLEWGTSRMKPRPYLRRAFYDRAQEVQAIVVSTIQKGMVR